MTNLWRKKKNTLIKYTYYVPKYLLKNGFVPISWKGGEKWNDCFFFFVILTSFLQNLSFWKEQTKFHEFSNFFFYFRWLFSNVVTFSLRLHFISLYLHHVYLLVVIHFTTYLHVVKLINNLIIILETTNTYKHESHERQIRTKPVLLINKTTINEEIFLERNFPSKKNRWSFGANYDLDMKPIDFFTQRKCWNFFFFFFFCAILVGLVLNM